MAPLYRIIILPEASSDLVHIFEYIVQDSPQNASSMTQRIFDTIDSLEYFPHRFKIHRSRKSPDRVIRSVAVLPFVIYYRIIASESVVEVLTVRHGARRPPRLR